MSIKHLDIRIKGLVQGVSFRFSTKAVADQLGVKGNVRNLADGDVFIEAEADKLTMDMFLDWCREGPERARVTLITADEGPLKNYRNFEIVKKGF